MEEVDENKIKEILANASQGNITSEEREELEAWANMSVENRKELEEAKLLYWVTDAIAVTDTIDTEFALRKFHRTLLRHRGQKVLLWYQRIAAILLIPLCLGYFIYLFMGRSQPVSWIEVKTNPGMITRVILPDSTSVDLNAQSTLKYPSTFNGSNTRKVELIGEAFFNVKKDKSKRFIIQTPHKSWVEVLGTSFNLEAYMHDSLVTTTLQRGSVKFMYEHKQRLYDVSLTPGHKVVYHTNTGQVEMKNTPGKTETAWKDGLIIFDNTPLKEALRILEKRYHVSFAVSNKQFYNSAFTGTFESQPLDQILNFFKLSSGMNWRDISDKQNLYLKPQIELY